MLEKWFIGFTALTLVIGMTAIASAEEGEATSADIFKQLDSNNDGKVTKDELNEKQVKFFDRLVRTGDKNKDGELSEEEFSAALNQNEQPVEVKGGRTGRGRGRDFSPEMIFKKLDKNSDGKLAKAELPEKFAERLTPLFEKLGKEEVTLAEFSEAIKKFRGKGGKPQDGKKNAKKLFERFDENKDGKITLAELPEKLQKQLKPVFEKVDKEALTLEDFMKLQSQRDKKGKGKGNDRAMMFFKRLDKNSDGKIQKDEVPEKFLERFGKMDANSDGVIDETEIKKAMSSADRPKGKRPKKGKRDEGFAKRILSKLDKNSDGKIQKSEAGKRMESRFDEIDRNGDGEVDLEELGKSFKRQKSDRPKKGKRPDKVKD